MKLTIHTDNGTLVAFNDNVEQIKNMKRLAMKSFDNHLSDSPKDSAEEEVILKVVVKLGLGKASSFSIYTKD